MPAASSPLANGHVVPGPSACSSTQGSQKPSQGLRQSPMHASSSSLRLPAVSSDKTYNCSDWTDVQAHDAANVSAPGPVIASHPLLERHAVYVADTPHSGRGVFAAKALRAGTLVEVSHVLLFDAQEYTQHGQHTQLDNYTYVWTKSSQGNTMALALGLGSLFNHSAHSPNLSFALDRKAGTIRYTLARNVEIGEELCICYGHGKMWWERDTEPRMRMNGTISSNDQENDKGLAPGMDDVSAQDENLSDAEDPGTELLMLSQLGIEQDQRDTHDRHRRAEQRRRELAKYSTLQRNDDSGVETGESSRSASLQRQQSTLDEQNARPAYTVPIAVGPDRAPLWRVTAALDPNTTPLELMPVWAVRIDPRKSENYMHFSRDISRRLRAAEWGDESSLQHLRSGESGDNDSSSGATDEEVESSDDEDDAMKHLRLFQRIEDGRGLNALVCRVQDMPSFDKIVTLLRSADLTSDGTDPCPYKIQVPRYPAPSRERLKEWKSYWPVSVKGGKVNNTLLKSSLSGGSHVSPGSTAPGVVDRAADARLWTEAATQWAARNFKKALAQARQAQERGELPIGVHVTSSFPDGNRIASGVPEDQNSIEVDAWDTRKSLRNPIKHAVTNAIRDVAKVRSERDWERLLVLNAKVAHLHRDPNVDPNAPRSRAEVDSAASVLANDRPTQSTVGVDNTKRTTEETEVKPSTSNGNGNGSSNSNSAGGSNSRMLNGQDYLLNNLTLFTTHEPCVSCCMALVHSRVRAVFFIEPSPGAGGCCGSGLAVGRQCAFAQDGGPYAVQEQAGLNHRFDVWRWVGDDSMLLGGDDDESVRPESKTMLRSARLDILGLDA